ncbi:MAG: MCP four helix bundle domain-containing protein, partial [Rhizobacter sp.]
MKLAHLKISTRLILGFSALAALMALLGAAAMYHLHSIDKQFDSVMEDRYPTLQIAGEIKGVNNEVSQAIRNLFVVSDPDDIKAQYDLIAGSSKRTSANIDKLTKMITSDAGKAALAKLNTARAEYRAPRDKVIELLKTGRSEEAKNVLLLDLRPKQVAYMDRLEDLIKLQEKMMVQSGEEVNRTVEQAKTAIVTLLVIAGVFAL